MTKRTRLPRRQFLAAAGVVLTQAAMAGDPARDPDGALAGPAGTGPGDHQMRGIPLVCMRTGPEGAGGMPVRQPLASPTLRPGAGDWRR